MSKSSPKPNFLVANVNVELDLSNYATKADLINTAGIDTSNFTRNNDLANSKSDLDKLENIQSNLTNLKSELSYWKIRNYFNWLK